jgi:magnesium transporter
VIVDCATYVDGSRVADGDPTDLVDSFSWVGLRMPTSAELASHCASLGWDDLSFAELVAPHDRPVLALESETMQLVLRTALFEESTETIQLGELSVIVGRCGIVTVRFGHATPLGDLRHRLESDPEWLRVGPTAVLASIIEEVIDDYRPALDGLERAAVSVERDVFSDSARRPIRRLYHLKREVRSLHLAISSLQDPLNRLLRQSDVRATGEVVARILEASEQLDRTVTRAASLSNLLDAALDATLAQVSVQQNDDMRRISAWVAMAAGPTLIAGVYGMNFENQPELRWRYGYLLVLLVMATLTGALFRAFRRSGWL